VIQVGRGLISQDELRLGDERPCDGNTLLLAAGEFRGILVALIGDADRFQQRQDAATTLGRACRSRTIREASASR